eukprot:g44531.t1
MVVFISRSGKMLGGVDANERCSLTADLEMEGWGALAEKVEEADSMDQEQTPKRSRCSCTTKLSVLSLLLACALLGLFLLLELNLDPRQPADKTVRPRGQERPNYPSVMKDWGFDSDVVEALGHNQGNLVEVLQGDSGRKGKGKGKAKGKGKFRTELPPIENGTLTPIENGSIPIINFSVSYSWRNRFNS